MIGHKDGNRGGAPSSQSWNNLSTKMEKEEVTYQPLQTEVQNRGGTRADGDSVQQHRTPWSLRL